MTRANRFILGTLILLGGIYVYFFGNWFKPKVIRIIPQNRPFGKTREGSAVNPVSFTLNGEYKLTSVKVVPVWTLDTNKTILPVWQLVTSSNSAPTRGFLYGLPIEGMEPSKIINKAEDLVPELPYRLMVEAGSAKGQVDFRPAPARP